MQKDKDPNGKTRSSQSVCNVYHCSGKERHRAAGSGTSPPVDGVKPRTMAAIRRAAGFMMKHVRLPKVSGHSQVIRTRQQKDPCEGTMDKAELYWLDGGVWGDGGRWFLAVFFVLGDGGWGGGWGPEGCRFRDRPPPLIPDYLHFDMITSHLRIP